MPFPTSSRGPLIRLASTLPVGSPARRTLLAGLRRTAAIGERVSARGIIDGYSEEGTKLQMLGPQVTVAEWAKIMMAALSPDDSYNDFSVPKVARWLKGFGVETVYPARENSVALYFPLPQNAILDKMLRGRPAAADEVSTLLGGPGGRAIDANWAGKSWAKTQQHLDAGDLVFVRMWWD